jgi:tetratricopeptide (TPR) repeat protein
MVKKKYNKSKLSSPTTGSSNSYKPSHAWWRDRNILVWVTTAVVMTLLVYFPNFSAEFVNWDDAEYVYENILIRKWEHFGQLLTTPVAGNYHPLTMITLALNYAVGGDAPFGYHLVNIILHLINVILVFHFIYLLADKKWEIALVTAVLFGVHPMHVESVAWVSERKDVLYALFFMFSLIYYLKYLLHTQRKYIIVAFVFFVFSLFSKPAAVVLPVILLIIDWYRSRGIFKWSVILEKIPFFIAAVLFGLFTLKVQYDRGAVGELDMFSWTDKFFFANYGLMEYLGRIFMPINLATFYPFPPINEPIPTVYHIAPFIVLAVAAFTIWWSRKRGKVLAFGMLFFLINLILVLQWLSVGSAVMADRYTYIAYIGLFFIIGYAYYSIIQKSKKYQIPAHVVMAIYILAMAYLGHQQTKTWENSNTLWSRAIEVWPSARAYTNRGGWLRKQGQLDQAMEDYNKGAKLDISDGELFVNRANIYFEKGQYDLALQDYNRSIKLKPDNASAFANRAAVYSRQGKYDLAIQDLNQAEIINPNHFVTYLNRAITYEAMDRYEDALKDYTTYLYYRPQHDGMWNARGICYRRLNQPNKALADYNKSIQLNPQVGIYYQNRAMLHQAMGNKPAARKDVKSAQQLGVQFSREFLQSIQ